MSFIPFFLSKDLAEPPDSFVSSAPCKTPFLKQVRHQLLHIFPPISLYQRVGRFSTREYLAKVTIRSHFDAHFEQDWQRLEAQKAPLSLLMCELDNFTHFRREQGDLACNNYLGQVVNVIHANIERPKGMLARYQGDTFAILLPQTSMDEAACIAKKVRLRVKALKDHPQMSQSMADQAITLSLGLSTVVPNSKLTPANVVAAAEQSLRQAQRAGGNRVILDEV